MKHPEMQRRTPGNQRRSRLRTTLLFWLLFTGGILLFSPLCARAASGAKGEPDASLPSEKHDALPKNGLYRQADGYYHYYLDGIPQTAFSGFYIKEGQRHYIREGIWQNSFQGIVQNPEDGRWYYVRKGLVKESFTGFYQGEDGLYYYIVEGVWKVSANRIAQAPSNGKYYLVQNGVISKDFNGFWTGKNGKTYYIQKGIWKKSTTKLVQIEGDARWHYVKDGIWNSGYCGFFHHPGGKYYYIREGRWEKGLTDLVLHPTNGKWYFVKNGYLQKSFTGFYLGESEHCRYVKKGIWQEGYRGIYTRSDGKKFYIDEGIWQKSFSGTILWKGYSFVIKKGTVRKKTLAPQKVILISIDGMRPDGFLNCGNDFTRTILSQSRYTLEGWSVFPSFTLPAHFSTFHSMGPETHGIIGNWYQEPEIPVVSLPAHLREQGKRSAMFYGWKTLRKIAGKDDFCHEEYRDAAKMEDGDGYLTDKLLAYLAEDQPDFVFLYLVDTDDKGGHLHGWMSHEYLVQLSHALDCARAVWEAHKDNYTILLMTDHGGHDLVHGTDCPEDMIIPFFAMGPGFKAGTTFSQFTLLDIAPTIARLLGVKPHESWEGTSLIK
ncbi:MAG: alkaline phosphatase family protein [Lachnospiraceae bacterium]|nr:alkaline phosphatase family protein [Lachnospiraceae bacterium]